MTAGGTPEIHEEIHCPGVYASPVPGLTPGNSISRVANGIPEHILIENLLAPLS